ncbi:hypothetical protein [Prevotella intermedia]|uniref:Uncharacterized protein n=1 Tax=Prevotella intermedia TaxID=28131 RepID=A0A2G8IC05_PREIN|nr:hypothetical protein [Prevotella intermedia]PIK21056.1 hypothetical protein CTI18_06825 [Prevotella intermedia]RQD99801.1 hypothetical protein D2S53_12565 [Prevotella intermedia]RRF86214.1 hypothetical protein D2S45_12660 [Prevotella intermedia]
MKKLNFIEMSTVYGGFDNDKCREVQKRGHELDNKQNGRITLCNTSEEEKAYRDKLEQDWEQWIIDFNKYCV